MEKEVEVIVENKNEVIVTPVEQETEEENKITLSRTYVFEGKKIDCIDLSGLENLRASDMIEANRILERSGSASFLPEMSLEYACLMAGRATGLPVEFFYALKPADSMKLKNRMIRFFYGKD